MPLSGWRVVVTGDVPGMTRDAAKDAVRGMGGTALGTVDARTDLLVVGTGAGAAKLAKAASLGLRQLPAAEFAELAENPDRWDGRPLGAVALPASDEEHPDAPPRRSAAAEPAPVPVPASAARSVHIAGITTWTRDGRWTVVARCACGHASEGGSAAEAEAGHRAHRETADSLERPDSA